MRDMRTRAGKCVRCGVEPPVGTSQCCPKCNLYIKNKASLENAKFKKIIFEFFDNKCSCCSETEPMFLTVDHINNDGHIARKVDKTGGSNFYRVLAKSIEAGNIPPDLQLLCRNCNWGKHVNGGVCPHLGRYM
jgi:hypothetical protein